MSNAVIWDNLCDIALRKGMNNMDRVVDQVDPRIFLLWMVWQGMNLPFTPEPLTAEPPWIKKSFFGISTGQSQKLKDMLANPENWSQNGKMNGDQST